MRQRDANLTALAAIGPRKKRKLDSPGATPSGTEVKTGKTNGYELLIDGFTRTFEICFFKPRKTECFP